MSLACAVLAALAATAVIYALIVHVHRRFCLIEYGTRPQACPACGRVGYGVRERKRSRDAWGPWRTPCCGALLQRPNSSP